MPAKPASASGQFRACRKTLAAAIWPGKASRKLDPNDPKKDPPKCRLVCISITVYHFSFAFERKNHGMKIHQGSGRRPIHEAVVHAGDIERHPRRQHDQALSLANDRFGDSFGDLGIYCKAFFFACQKLSTTGRSMKM